MGWASLHPGKEFWQIRSVIRAVSRKPSREIAADDMRRIGGASLFFVDAGDDGNATSLPLRSRRNRKGSTRQSPKAIPDVGNTVIPKLATSSPTCSVMKATASSAGAPPRTVRAGLMTSNHTAPGSAGRGLGSAYLIDGCGKRGGVAATRLQAIAPISAAPAQDRICCHAVGGMAAAAIPCTA